MQEEQEIRAELLDQLSAFPNRIVQFEQAKDALRESEEKWHILLKSSPDAILNLERDGTILFINHHTVLGYTIEDTVGKTVYDFIPPEEHEKTRKAIEKIFQTGEAVSFETSVKGPDGELLWYSTRLGPVKERDKVVSVAQISTDITKRKKMEEALRESELRYHTFFESMPVAIGLANKEGQILDCNDAVLQMTGYSHAEIRQVNLKDIYKNPEEHASLLKQLQTDGIVNDFEAQFKRKDGTTYWVSLTIVPFAFGREDVLLTVAQDITERKKAEQIVQTLTESITGTTGQEAFDRIVTNLCKWLDVEFAIIGQVVKEEQVNILSMYSEGEIIHDYSYSLDGTPCDHVIQKGYCVYSENVQMQFPKDKDLVELKAEGYVGTPLWSKKGKVIGVLCAVSRQKLNLPKETGPIMHILATKASAEIERKEVEEQLINTRKRLEYILATNPVTIYTCEAGGNWAATFISENIRKQFDYKPNQFLEDRNFWVAHIHPNDRERVLSGLSRLFRDDFHVHEYRFLHKDGSYRWVHDEMRLIRDGQGKPLECIGYWTDITEFKQAQDELDKYRVEMARAEQLASLGILSASVAHELKQPLTVLHLSIENALEKLEITSSPVTVKEELKDSLDEVSNIISTIERFRNFTRKSSKQILKEVDLKAVGERIVKLLNGRAQRARITLHLKGIDKLPLLYSNEKDMEQLFFTLVDNAIQASDRTKERLVIISGAVKNEYIELHFSDNCGGIAPENLDRIFEPFFTTKSAGEGTGLGLCIVQRIVSRAGGKVRVESKFGKGSTFFVTLPINRDGR